jgi:serine/threonine protein kinase
VQSSQHKRSSEQANLGELQSSLDDYVGKRLSFDELRTQWITRLAGNPDIRGGALRLLYKQPLSKHLPEVKILSLKRIVETAIEDDPEDWTVEMEVRQRTEPLPTLVSKNTTAVRRVTEIAKTPSSVRVLPGINGHRPKSQVDSSKNRSIEMLAPGHVLNDRFVIEQPLGRGGSGDVYRARDRLRAQANAATIEIAVKVLRKDSRADPWRLDTLQQEALLTQSLSHPNIVRVYDFHKDGETRFLTMELLEGDVLKALFSRIQPSVVSRQRSIKIIRGMCLGLAHAHANGFVHADFKPGNVFLTVADEPKILDFGLAPFTAAGARAGGPRSIRGDAALRAITPAYASCNRLDGGVPVLSDDVYSLSCVIYELLAGVHPYQRKSATEARRLGLRPTPIAGLTEVQWRTLAAGLQLSSTHGTIQVHDLLDAFNATSPPKPARAPVARNAPIAKKKARSWTLVAAAAFLCGAGAVIAMTLLGIQPIDARYIDLARESGFMQFVQSAPGDPKDAAGIRKAVTPATSPDVDSVPTNLVAELPVAASRQVSDANESDTSVPGLADGDVGRTNGLRAAPVDDSELVIGASSPEDVMAATTAGIPGFQLGSAEYSIEENGQALAVEIYRQGNLSIPASVELTTYSVSAESGVDFANFERHEIRFAAGEASKTIFVPIVADATPEGSEVFRIALGNSLGEMILTEGAIATVIILDDDV